MSLVALQKKIGVTADGAFGPGTMKAAMAFYKMTQSALRTSSRKQPTNLVISRHSLKI